MLEVNQLTKSYPLRGKQAMPVVQVDTFCIQSGETLAMYGESGSGKRPSLIFGGNSLPDEGSICLDGKELSVLSENQRDLLRARSIGYVFQSFHLLQGCTALENVLLAMSFAGNVEREWAEEMITRVGLKERMHHKPGRVVGRAATTGGLGSFLGESSQSFAG